MQVAGKPKRRKKAEEKVKKCTLHICFRCILYPLIVINGVKNTAELIAGMQHFNVHRNTYV